MPVLITLFDLFPGYDIQLLSEYASSLSLIFLDIVDVIGGMEVVIENLCVSWDLLFVFLNSETLYVCIFPFCVFMMYVTV